MLRLASLTVCALLVASVAWAQTTSGEIRGVLSSARGPLAGVEVRIKNSGTGAITTTTTAATGEYAATVTPGLYEAFASPVGYFTFARRQIAVSAGATARADGVLTDNPNAGTPGEISFLYQSAEKAAPKGPAPRTADGKPDLSGVWFPGPDLEPEDTPFQPWAAAAARDRAQRPGDDPRAQCLPTGVTRTHALDLVKLVQTPSLLLVLAEGSVPGTRQVFLDGREHPSDLWPTWLGHSVGRWEHDTLVIDTIGFNDKVWIEGQRPQTEQLHVVERYRRIDLGHIDLEITIDDPGAYTRPWKMHRRLQLAVGEEIREYICNENNKTEHYVGAGNR